MFEECFRGHDGGCVGVLEYGRNVGRMFDAAIGDDGEVGYAGVGSCGLDGLGYGVKVALLDFGFVFVYGSSVYGD